MSLKCNSQEDLRVTSQLQGGDKQDRSEAEVRAVTAIYEQVQVEIAKLRLAAETSGGEAGEKSASCTWATPTCTLEEVGLHGRASEP